MRPGAIASPLNALCSPHSILFSRHLPRRYHPQICRFGLSTLKKNSRFTASASRLCARSPHPLTPTPLHTLRSPLFGVIPVFLRFSSNQALTAILTIGIYPFRILYCYISPPLCFASCSRPAVPCRLTLPSCPSACPAFPAFPAFLPHRSAAHSPVRRPQSAVVAQRHADHRWREVCLPVLHQRPPRERLQPHWYLVPPPRVASTHAKCPPQIANYTTSTPRDDPSSSANTVAARASPNRTMPSASAATARTSTRTKPTPRVSRQLTWALARFLIMPQSTTIAAAATPDPNAYAASKRSQQT